MKCAIERQTRQIARKPTFKIKKLNSKHKPSGHLNFEFNVWHYIDDQHCDAAQNERILKTSRGGRNLKLVERIECTKAHRPQTVRETDALSKSSLSKSVASFSKLSNIKFNIIREKQRNAKQYFKSFKTNNNSDLSISEQLIDANATQFSSNLIISRPVRKIKERIREVHIPTVKENNLLGISSKDMSSNTSCTTFTEQYMHSRNDEKAKRSKENKKNAFYKYLLVLQNNINQINKCKVQETALPNNGIDYRMPNYYTFPLKYIMNEEDSQKPIQLKNSTKLENIQ